MSEKEDFKKHIGVGRVDSKVKGIAFITSKSVKIVQPWDDTQLPIYKCVLCGQIQAYTGKGEPHCIGCAAFLSAVDIVDYIKKPE